MSGRTPAAVLDRRRAVVGGLVLGGVALAATTAPWVRATTSSALQPELALSVPGSDAAAASAAGALVVVAAALAMALGGRWGARVAAVGVVLGGVLVVASAVAVLADPEGPAALAAQGAVGVSTLTGEATTTPAVWLALLAGSLAVLLGLVAVVVAGGWARGGRRHDRPVAPPAGTWPHSAGSTPSADSADGGPGAPRAPGADREGPVDHQDAWDALSRGEDPT